MDNITAKRMFGGYGIYADDVMFALVAGQELYLKVDDSIQPLFEAKGLECFKYQKNGKPVKMSYFKAPDIIFDDPDEALKWGEQSLIVAKKNKKTQKKSRYKV